MASLRTPCFGWLQKTVRSGPSCSLPASCHPKTESGIHGSTLSDIRQCSGYQCNRHGCSCLKPWYRLCPSWLQWTEGVVFSNPSALSEPKAPCKPQPTSDQSFQWETPKCFQLEGKGIGIKVKHPISEPQPLRCTKEPELTGHLHGDCAKAGCSIGSLRNTISKHLSTAGWDTDSMLHVIHKSHLNSWLWKIQGKN